MPAAVVAETNPVDADQPVRFAESNAFAKIAFGRVTVTVVFTALLQLPARSWTRRLNRCAPGGIPASGTVATMLVPTRLTGTRVALPAPGSAVPIQNSAAANDTSLTGAVRVRLSLIHI